MTYTCKTIKKSCFFSLYSIIVTGMLSTLGCTGTNRVYVQEKGFYPRCTGTNRVYVQEKGFYPKKSNSNQKESLSLSKENDDVEEARNHSALLSTASLDVNEHSEGSAHNSASLSTVPADMNDHRGNSKQSSLIIENPPALRDTGNTPSSFSRRLVRGTGVVLLVGAATIITGAMVYYNAMWASSLCLHGHPCLQGFTPVRGDMSGGYYYNSQ